MTDRHDIDILAAEYVLGTLEPQEKHRVERQRQTDEELDQAILRWEQDFAPLNDLLPSVKPDSSVFTKLESRLDQHIESIQAPRDTTSVQSRGQPDRYKKLANRWRLMALASSMVAACLATILIFRGAVERPVPQEFLAVFQENDLQPAFYMTIDLSTQALTIVPVTADQQPDRSYQLWIVSNETGPDPKSLGLLDSIENPTQKLLGEFKVETLKTATFGISLEPEGGLPRANPQARRCTARYIRLTSTRILKRDFYKINYDQGLIDEHGNDALCTWLTL